MNSILEYIELNEAGIEDEVLQEFDCGNQDMTDYLHFYAKEDCITGKGVTYVLVREDKKCIYAYVTIHAHSLYYYDYAEKYHTFSDNKDGKILLSVPAVEIKMFAISRRLKRQVAYLLDPIQKQHYASIFFKLFLEKLYFMSMSIIGFQLVFLRANDEGERLYRKNGFIECDKYLNTYDVLAEGCTPLTISMTEIEKVVF